MKRVLVIAAHPDDEIYGMGGTIARLSDEGKEVYLLIVTDGSSAQYRNSDNLHQIIEKKKKETENAASIVGITAVRYGGLPDMKLDQVEHIKINEVIEKVIDEIQPDTVFTHFYGDVNMDHRRVYESTMVAIRPTSFQVVRACYCYNVPSSTEWQPMTAATAFMPNYFIDISKYSEKKEAAIKAYDTELREYPHPRSAEAVVKNDNVAGLSCGMDMCEQFVMVRRLEK